MNYLGNSFAIPSFLAFVDFFAWAIVFSRMSNLRIPITWRLFILVWISATLSLAVIDLNDVHHFSTEKRAFAVVCVKSVIRLGNLGVAFLVYRLLAAAYPKRMNASVNEPSVSEHEELKL